jgi:hypothetical protein
LLLSETLVFVSTYFFFVHLVPISVHQYSVDCQDRWIRNKKKKGKKPVQAFIWINILLQGLRKAMKNVRPNDLWAATRTLDLRNTKKCYQLDEKYRVIPHL